MVHNYGTFNLRDACLIMLLRLNFKCSIQICCIFFHWLWTFNVFSCNFSIIQVFSTIFIIFSSLCSPVQCAYKFTTQPVFRYFIINCCVWLLCQEFLSVHFGRQLHLSALLPTITNSSKHSKTCCIKQTILAFFLWLVDMQLPEK